MNLLATMELVGPEEIDKIMRIDYPTLTTKREKFFQDNRGSYYLVINTWLMQLKQYSKYGWMSILGNIKEHGLLDVINTAQNTAQALIAGIPVDTDCIFFEVIRDISVDFDLDVHLRRRNNEENCMNKFALILQVLRYPKRLSLAHVDLLNQRSINEFLDVENRLKVGLENNKYQPTHHLISLKRLTLNLFDWDNIIKDVRRVINDPYAFDIPTGSTSDVGRLGIKKLRRLSEEHPEWFHDPFGIPYVGLHVSRVEERIRCSHLSAVPKTYKKSRIIAPEPVSRQAKGAAIGRVLQRYLPDNIPITDQSVNQGLAYAGSIGAGYATIDQSNASDTFTEVHFRTIFPLEFVNMIVDYLPEYCVYYNKKSQKCFKPLMTLTTAGNSLTFILESMFFYAIDMYATELVRTFECDSSLYDPYVYGDDQVVDCRIVDTLFDIMRSLGLKPNVEKSFYSGSYRESCGKEYYDGVEVSSVYYPRRVIKVDFKNRKPVFTNNGQTYDTYRQECTDVLSLLVSLQRRLYGPCYEASRFVAEFVKAGEPRMTSIVDSYDGTDRPDLFAYCTTYGPVIKPPVFDRSVAIPKEVLDTSKSYFAPHVFYEKSKLVDGYLERLFNVYRYNRFLKNGPEYEDPFLEMLHISKKPPTIHEIAETPSVRWRFTK